MKYKQPEILSKNQILSIIENGTEIEIATAIISAALYIDDLDWVQNLCIKLSQHNHFNIRGNAILCFGHLARIHKKLNKKKIVPIIKNGLKDSNEYVRGQASDAKDDVCWYLKWKL